MEILVFLGVLNVLVILAIVFWPKREPPDLDWKSCAMRREEEERRRLKKIEEDKYRMENLKINPVTGDAVLGGGIDINGNPVL